MRRTLIVSAFATGLVWLAVPAGAQTVVATVNGRAVTSFDVEQRIRLEAVTAGRRISRSEATDEVINDQLKVEEARRAGFRLTDDDVDKAIERVAKNNRQTVEQLYEALRQRGLARSALRDKFQAELAWNSVVSYRSRNTAPSNSEINAIVEERLRTGKANVTDYLLHQVIFIVPGAAPAIAAQRTRDAEAARGRFQGCDTGLDMLRHMNDVAVRQPVSRTSTDLPKPLLDLLEKTPVGKLSPVYRTDQGIETLAVCEKNERVDISAVRQQVESELSNRKVEVNAKKLLDEIRSRATIVRH